MAKSKKALLVLFISSLLLSESKYSLSASYSCIDAKSNVEKLVCSDKTTSKLDEDLGNAYKAALLLSKDQSSLKKEQSSWLVQLRNKCESVSCLTDVYQKRIDELDYPNITNSYRTAELLQEQYQYNLAESFLIRVAKKENENALYALGMLTQVKRDDVFSVLKKAASNGDMDALFVLAQQYNIDSEKNIYLAAKGGSTKAVKWLVDSKFYLTDDKFSSHRDPHLVYKYYLEGKRTNPSLTFYNEKQLVEDLIMCSEVEPLPLKQFLQNNKLDENASPWTQARLISAKENNPKLILQLVCLGGDVPAERSMAVQEAYTAYKNNKRLQFNGCLYAQAKYSMGGCLDSAHSIY